MKNRSYSPASFSLVEVTLALAIAGLCLVSLFALLPIGIQGNQNSASQTAVASIVDRVATDLRVTPKTRTTSSLYQITFGTETLLYVDEHGKTANPNDSNMLPIYRVQIGFPSSSPGPFAPTFVSLKITWPALADTARSVQVSSLETFIALNRN